MSIKSGEANMRVGPGKNFPISWVYRKAGMPVEVIDRHNEWLQVRDTDGDSGWFHNTLLSGKRFAVVKQGLMPLRANPSLSSQVILSLRHGVLLQIHNCRREWCRGELLGRKGWCRKKDIWGVYPDEQFE